MDKQPLIHFLNNITNLSEGLKKDIEEFSIHETYKTHQVILAQGQQETRAWYVAKGVARSYIYDDKGAEITLRFWNRGEFIFSNGAIFNIPSLLYVEILEDAELFSISYPQVSGLLVNYPETKCLLSKIFHEHMKKDIAHNLLFAMSAESRYLKLRKENPEVFRVSPLRIIASYLHISREGLSRIINRDTK